MATAELAEGDVMYDSSDQQTQLVSGYVSVSRRRAATACQSEEGTNARVSSRWAGGRHKVGPHRLRRQDWSQSALIPDPPIPRRPMAALEGVGVGPPKGQHDAQ